MRTQNVEKHMHPRVGRDQRAMPHAALPEAIAAKQRSHSKEMTLPIKGRGRANSSQPHSRREHTMTGTENTDPPGPKTLSAKVMGREIIWGFGVALVRQTD